MTRFLGAFWSLVFGFEISLDCWWFDDFGNHLIRSIKLGFRCDLRRFGRHDKQAHQNKDWSGLKILSLLEAKPLSLATNRMYYLHGFRIVYLQLFTIQFKSTVCGYNSFLDTMIFENHCSKIERKLLDKILEHKLFCMLKSNWIEFYLYALFM